MSWRSQGIYYLDNPELLKSGGGMIPASLKMFKDRDKLILKLNFMRYALQYAIGMNTAAITYEELFTDKESLFLLYLDSAVHSMYGSTNPQDVKKDERWYEVFFDNRTVKSDYSPDSTATGERYTSPKWALNGSASLSALSLSESDFVETASNLGLKSYENMTHIDLDKKHIRDEVDLAILKTMCSRIKERLECLFDAYRTGYDKNVPESMKTVEEKIAKLFPQLYKRVEANKNTLKDKREYLFKSSLETKSQIFLTVTTITKNSVGMNKKNSISCMLVVTII